MSSTHSQGHTEGHDARESGTTRQLISHQDIGFAFGIPGAPAMPRTPRPHATPGHRPPRVARWVKVARFALPTVGLVAALGGMVALTVGAGCTGKKNPPAEPSTTAPLAQVTASSPSAMVLDVHAPATPAATTPAITLPTEPVTPPAPRPADRPAAAAPAAAAPTVASRATSPLAGVSPPAPLAQDPVLTQTPKLASSSAGPSSRSASAAAGAKSGATSGTTSGASGASGATPRVAPRPASGARGGASTAPTSGPSTGASTYTVQKGDTLYKIARDHYGDGRQWSRIAAANPGLFPATLKAGQKLKMP